MSLIVNRRDLDFQLDEVPGIEHLFESARHASFDRDTIDEIFNAAQRMVEEAFLPTDRLSGATV